MRVNKSFLTKAVLASSVFITLLPTTVYAVLTQLDAGANAQNSGVAPYNTPANGYVYVASPVNFTILDGTNIGADLNGVSIDNAVGSGATSIMNFAGSSTVSGTVGPTFPISDLNVGVAGKTVGFQGNVAGNIFFTSTGTATIADNVTITGNVDSQNANQGILRFLGNGSITGTIGATQGLDKVYLDGAGKTVTFSKSILKGTELNFNADAIANIADGASLATVDNEAGASSKGTLNFLGTSTVDAIGTNFGNGLVAVNILGANSTQVSFTGNVGNDTPIIFKNDGNIDFADNVAVGDIDNQFQDYRGVAYFLGSGSAKNIGVTNPLFEVQLNNANGLNETITITGTTLNAGVVRFQGSNPTTLALNQNGMNVDALILAQTNNVHTVNIKDNTTLTGRIGTSTRQIKTVLDAGKTLTLTNGSGLFGTVDGAGTLTYLGSTNIIAAIGGTTPLTAVNFNGVAGKNANLNGNITVTGDVTVNNGGTLTINNTNTVTATNLTIANGTLALGPNTTANVVGKFNLNNNNDTLILNIGGQAASTPLLAVTGVATVGVGGGNLTVINPEYKPGNLIVPIITGGVGSALAPLTIINSNTFMTSFSNQVSGDTLNLVITSKSLSNFADQTNNIGAALSLNSLAASGANVTGDLKNIINQVNTFGDAGTLNYALSTLSPTVNGAVLNESINAQNETFDAITDHFDTQAFWQKHYGKSSSGMSNGDAQEPSSAWVKIFKQYGNQAQRGDILGYKNDTWGIIAGGDAYVKDNILVGLALSWANLDMHDKRSAYETTRANSYQASVYANLECDTPWYYNGIVAVAYNEYRSDRNIVFGNVNLFPHADYDGWQTGAKVESGYVYDFDTMQFVPHTSLFYSHLSLNSYTETGANTANLFVDDADFDAMLWGGGFKFIKEVALENERFFQSEIHTRVFYDLFGDTMALTSQFTGGGPNFRTAGFTPARFSYNVGGNVSLYSRHNWVFTLSYDYDAKADYHANAGFLRIRHEF